MWGNPARDPRIGAARPVVRRSAFLTLAAALVAVVLGLLWPVPDGPLQPAALVRAAGFAGLGLAALCVHLVPHPPRGPAARAHLAALLAGLAALLPGAALQAAGGTGVLAMLGTGLTLAGAATALPLHRGRFG